MNKISRVFGKLLSKRPQTLKNRAISLCQAPTQSRAHLTVFGNLTTQERLPYRALYDTISLWRTLYL